MQQFLVYCLLAVVATFTVLHFLGILSFLAVLGALHYCYILRIRRFARAKEEGKIGKLDEVRQGVETRMWVSFVYLLFLDVAFYSVSNIVGRDVYEMKTFSRNISETQMGIFILMVIVGGFLAAYSTFSMMQNGNKQSEVKKYLLAFSVACISGGGIGFMLISWQNIAIPFSSSSVIVFSVKDIAGVVVFMYVVASFFSARYSCKSGDRATVYFLGLQLYTVDGHGDVVVPVPSLTLQLLLDLIKQDYILFSVDWEAVRLPLVHSAPHRTLNIKMEQGASPSPTVSVVSPSPSPGGAGNVQRQINPDDLIHPYVRAQMMREKESRTKQEVSGGRVLNRPLKLRQTDHISVPLDHSTEDTGQGEGVDRCEHSNVRSFADYRLKRMMK